jgi:hypothetical protein
MKIQPNHIDFHRYVQEVNEGLDEIDEQKLLILEGNREQRLVQLVGLLDKYRLTIKELIDLIK